MAGYKGKFLPKNTKKYKGDPTTIIYRSLLERRFMVMLDENQNVILWNSEEVIVPYFFEVDKKMHRYFIDFFIRMKCGETTRDYLIEIKPKSQTQIPKSPKKRKTRRYINECLTYLKNQAKWEAATAFAKHNNMEFRVVTEKDFDSYK